MSGKFSSEVIKLAQESQAKYGVPASVTLAQYALESGYGSSNLAKNYNNYFGITGSNNGNSTTINGRKWRTYSSMAESFDDHGELLSSGRYAQATQGVTSAGQYVDAIAEIYAPSSDGNNNYAGNLKKIIQDNNLTQYDTISADGATSYLYDSMMENASLLDSNGTQIGYTAVGYFSDKWHEILANIIRIIVYLFLAVLAFILFMNAFQLNPKQAIANKAAEKVKEVIE